jgi:hypothetical protein
LEVKSVVGMEKLATAVPNRGITAVQDLHETADHYNLVKIASHGDLLSLFYAVLVQEALTKESKNSGGEPESLKLGTASVKFGIGEEVISFL